MLPLLTKGVKFCFVVDSVGLRLKISAFKSTWKINFKLVSISTGLFKLLSVVLSVGLGKIGM